MDAWIVIIYLASLFLAGLYFKAKSSSLKTYSYVQKSIRTNRLFLAATIFAGSVGGGTTFGLTEKILEGNLAYSYALLATISVDILVAIYLVPRIARFYGAISIGDIFEKNYGTIGRMMAGLGVVISSVGFLAAQIKVSTYLLRGIFGFEQNLALIASYAVIIAYTALGGLRSVIVNNFIQFCAMVFGIILFSYFALHNLNMSEVISSIPSYKYDITETNLLFDTFCLVLTFSVVICQPTFIQRAILNKDAKFMRDAVITKSIIYLFFISIIILNALIISYLYPNVGANYALIESIKDIVPAGISGIVIIGFLSAAMSTADGDLNIASLSVSRDILKPIFHFQNPKILVIITQITTFIIGIMSIYVCLKFQNIVDIVLIVANLWAPWLLVPFIASLYDIRISKIALVLASLCGILSSILWDYISVIKLQGIFVGFLVNLICFVISYYYGRRRRRG